MGMRPLFCAGSVAYEAIAAAMLSGAQAADVVRLPAEVEDPACFDVGPGDQVTFDLRDCRWIASFAVAGLIRQARLGPVHLRLTPGPVREKLRRLLAEHLVQLGGGDDWLLTVS